MHWCWPGGHGFLTAPAHYAPRSLPWAAFVVVAIVLTGIALERRPSSSACRSRSISNGLRVGGLFIVAGLAKVVLLSASCKGLQNFDCFSVPISFFMDSPMRLPTSGGTAVRSEGFET